MTKKIITLLISLFSATLIWGVTISDIENAYVNGTLHINHSFLRLSSADEKDLSACKLYYTAKLNSVINKSKQFYAQAYQKASDDKYGQMANLELAKLDFFNREYDNALEKLKNLTLLNERFYWQARIYCMQKKWAHTIISVDNYLTNESKGDFALELNALLLDVYLAQNKPVEFHKVKEGMTKFDTYSDFEAYALYKEGLLFDKQNEPGKAIEKLRLLTEKYPKSQYRVFADDLILEYNKKNQHTVKVNTSETETITSQPQSPKPVSKKLVSFTELGKGKAYIQYGVFSTLKLAEKYKQQLEVRGINLFVISKMVNDKEYFALIQGPFTSKESANTFLTNVKSNNINAFLLIP